MKIPIVFTFDENYVAAGSVAIQSLLATKNPETEYEIIVVHSGLSGEAKAKLEQWHPVRWIKFEPEKYGALIVSDRYNIACWYAAFLPEILTEYDTNLLTKLIDEDTGRVGLVDRCCQLTKCLAHQTCLQANPVVSHFAFYFRLWRKGGHGIHHNNINSRTADKLIGYLQCLFSIVWLTDKKAIDIHAQFLCIETVESMFGIDKGGNATCLLCFCYSVDGKRSLT